jgi:hypothetical protein
LYLQFFDIRLYTVKLAPTNQIAWGYLYISALIQDVENKLGNDIIVVLEDTGDLVGDPALDELDIDLLHVNLHIELGRELGRTQQPLVHVGC